MNHIKQYSMSEEKNTIIVINNSVSQATQDKMNEQLLEEIETTIIFS